MAIPCPTSLTFPQGNEISKYPANKQSWLDYSSAEVAAAARQHGKIAWIISSPRLVQLQDVLIEDVAKLPRNQCGEVIGLRSGCPKGVKEADNKLN
jgi:hypothetical protein